MIKPLKQRNYFLYLTRVYAQNPVFGRSGTIRQGKLSNGLKAAKGKAGVYRIFEDKKLVYVGNSRSDLARTILRHFQNWKDSNYRTNYRVDQKSYLIEITVIKDRNEKEVLALEQALIDRAKTPPRDNTNLVYGKYNNKYKAPDEDKEACLTCYKNAVETKAEIAIMVNNDDIPF